jgi:hypothetical protein
MRQGGLAALRLEGDDPAQPGVGDPGLADDLGRAPP